MAKIPASLLASSDPKLVDLTLGDMVYVAAFGMCVTPDGDCFLRPDVSFTRQRTALSPLRVQRADDGFHVTVIGKAKWSPDTPPDRVKGWIPIAAIDEQFDPELDVDQQIEDLLRRVGPRA